MEEQRKRVRSYNPAERFAAALLIPAELSRRLRPLGNSEIAQLLDDEVCENMSILAPEATVCVEAALRLRRAMPKTRNARSLQARVAEDGEHILHAEAALYRAGIPFLQLPWQMNRFASSTFLVSDVVDAKLCLLGVGFREAAGCPTVVLYEQTRRAIHLYEHRTQLYSTDKRN
jgi:hypothetical protein